jgi:hypothetical protein
MDELDKLKNHWKKSEENFPQVTETEIYGMLHKRSSSAVKWILIISILEFAFWGVISLSNSIFNLSDYNDIPAFLAIMDYANYFIALTFIILFYINYRKISTERPVKGLLDNIIRVRRIVTVYMVYNVAVILTSMIISLSIVKADTTLNNPQKALVAGVIIITLFLSLIGIIYYLLYGRLVRKLNKNYRELQKISGL